VNAGAPNTERVERIAAPIGTIGEGYLTLISLTEAILRLKIDLRWSNWAPATDTGFSEGGCLARRLGIETGLVGVEADPDHFAEMQQHLALNRLDARLINAPINGPGGAVHLASGPGLGFGQGIVYEGYQYDAAKVIELRAITLPDVLFGLDRVDLIHMDVQGVELEVLASSDLSRIGTLIIGTHSGEIEAGLRSLLKYGQPLFDYSINGT
jgi:FkbM family methyltransferase